MQPVLSTRIYRLFRSTPMLWAIAAFCALPPLYELLCEPFPTGCMELARGNTILPFAAALLCVAYTAAGYEGGELRNCVPSGRSRAAAYFAPLVAEVAGTLLVCAAYLLPSVLMGAMHGWVGPIEPIVRVVIGCVTGTLGILCICHALCMRLERPVAMLLAIAVVLVVMLMVSAQIMQALDEPEIVPMYEVSASTGVETYVGSVPNPSYPTDEEWVALSLWLRAIPTSFMWYTEDPDPGFWLGQAANAVLFSLIGFCSFRRRNLS